MRATIGAALSGLVLVVSGCGGCLDLRGCGTSSKLYAARQLRAMGKPTCRRDADCAKVLTCPSSRAPLCEEDWGTAGPGYCDCAPTQKLLAWTDAGKVMCADAGVPVYDDDASAPMPIRCSGVDDRCGRYDNNTADILDEDGGILVYRHLRFCREGGLRW